MAEGSLSQDEIDALLQGLSAPAAPSAAPAAGGGIPGFDQRMARAVGRAASVLSTLFSRKLEFSPAGGARVGPAALWRETPGGLSTVFQAEFTGAVTGPVVIAMAQRQAAAIADLMMGGDASNPPAELDEIYASAVREAMSQGFSAIANALSEELGGAVSVTPPEMRSLDLSSDTNLPLGNVAEIAVLPLKAMIEGAGDGPVAVGLSSAAARTVAGSTAAAPPSRVSAAPAPAHAAPVAAPVTYQPVQFSPLAPSQVPAMPKNIELLLDVPMQMTVELGRTSMFVKDILDLGTGSIIELDKLAGEPVDLLVNGKLVARGEVVVIDENFGVRVTDVISPMERIRSIQ